jgi:hypothetical protein
MDTVREWSPAIQVRVRLQNACFYAAADVSAAFAQCQYSTASYHGSELATDWVLVTSAVTGSNNLIKNALLGHGRYGSRLTTPSPRFQRHCDIRSRRERTYQLRGLVAARHAKLQRLHHDICECSD